MLIRCSTASPPRARGWGARIIMVSRGRVIPGSVMTARGLLRIPSRGLGPRSEGGGVRVVDGLHGGRRCGGPTPARDADGSPSRGGHLDVDGRVRDHGTPDPLAMAGYAPPTTMGGGPRGDEVGETRRDHHVPECPRRDAGGGGRDTHRGGGWAGGGGGAPRVSSSR